MRKDYVMSDEQLEVIVEASKPVPLIIINGRAPLSQQAKANAAWQALGKALGFDWVTVRPNGPDQHSFSAETLDVTTAVKPADPKKPEEKKNV